MLSYRHAFHAGNFADVHKHVAWLLGIQALQRKNSSFCLIDAYAGAGMYGLDDPAAERTGEWRDGIGRLLPAPGNAPAELQHYLALIETFNPGATLSRYPGSPVLAASQLREHDRLVCLELHPADYPLLKQRFAREPRVHVHRRDAREGLPALVPPAEKRGLVLVDPPYERAAEYDEVPAMLKKALARWPNGGFLLWYPLLTSNAHVRMLDALAADADKLLVQELRLFPDAPGLRGSGIAWINPPWQVDAALERSGEWLLARLGASPGTVRTEWRVSDRA